MMSWLALNLSVAWAGSGSSPLTTKMKEKEASTRGPCRCRRHRQPRSLRRRRRHQCRRVKLTTFGGVCSILGVTRPQGPLVLRCLTSHCPTLPLSMIGSIAGRPEASTIAEVKANSQWVSCK